MNTNKSNVAKAKLLMTLVFVIILYSYSDVTLILFYVTGKSFHNDNNSENRTSVLQKLLPSFPDPSFSTFPPNKNLRLIMLVARFRSGSTYFGELFNQNPEVLYDYESLHPYSLYGNIVATKGKPVIEYKNYHTPPEIHMLYLQQILHNCSIIISAFGRVQNKFWK